MSRVAFSLYLAALVLAPLAFGTVETWALTLMEGLILAALGLFFLDRLRRSDRPVYQAPGLILLALVPLYYAAQLLPLPPALIRLLSPVLFANYQVAIGPDASVPWLPLSALPKATFGEVCRFMAYGGGFFLTIQFGAKRRSLETILQVMVFTAAFIALESMAQATSARGLIYWFRSAPTTTPAGPYVYRNHFAGYMEMVLPLALGLFFYSTPQTSSARSRREKFIEFFRQPGLSRHTLLGISATLIGTSIFVSLSRGGIVCMSLSLPLLLLILHQRGIISRRTLLAFLIPSFILVFVGWFGWEKIVERFLAIHQDNRGFYDARLEYWRDILPMIRDFWLTGSGAGTFETVFPAYQSSYLPGLVVNHAHQDYLEILATSGVVGASLLGVFLLRQIRTSHALIVRRRSRYSLIVWAAALTGITAICLHAFLDFNFYNGANGLYFFTLCGLLMAGAISKTGGRKRAADHVPTTRAISPVRLGFGIVLSVVLLGTVLTINLQSMAAGGIFREISAKELSTALPRQELLDLETTTQRLVDLDPREFRYRYFQGSVETLRGDDRRAEAFYRQALLLNPFSGDTLCRLAEFPSGSLGASQHERYYQAALKVDRVDVRIYLEYADWLIRQKRLDEGLSTMRQAVELYPGVLPEVIAALRRQGLGAVDMLKAVPDDLDSRLALGGYLDRIGRIYGASYVYNSLEGMIDAGVPPRTFLQIARHYSQLGMTEDAIRILQRGILLNPADASLKLQLGEQLGKMNRDTEAEAALRGATLLDPNDLAACISLGAQLSNNGQSAAAGAEFTRAIELMGTTVKLKPEWVKAISDFYQANGDSKQALRVIRQGISKQPGDPKIRMMEGDLLVELGRKVEAVRIYQELLLESPASPEPRQRLVKLGAIR